jgi:ABC-type bacteriocin/lantibiotic exporter with double-glycine peptidase domain
MNYELMTHEGLMVHENNDCAVIALALAIGCTYDSAYWQLRRLGRVDNAPTELDILLKACRQVGYRLRKVKTTQKTTKTLHKDVLLLDNETYLVVTCDHVATMLNKRIECYCKDKNYRIQSVYRMRKIEWRIY